jgi:hypothetical protein
MLWFDHIFSGGLEYLIAIVLLAIVGIFCALMVRFTEFFNKVFDKFTSPRIFLLFLFITSSLSVVLMVHYVMHYYVIGEDELTYIFQAKLFSKGRFFAEKSDYDGFISFVHWIEREGKYISRYNFAHPFMLMLGVLLGSAWITSVILAGLTPCLLYLFCREIFGRNTAVASAILLVSSPLYLLMSATMMSHTTALFFLILSFYAFSKTLKDDGIIYPIIWGLSFGFLVSSRPLTSLPYFLSMGSIYLFHSKLIKNEDGKLFRWKWIIQEKLLAKVFVFLLSLSFIVIFILTYNLIQTGDPFLFGYHYFSYIHFKFYDQPDFSLDESCTKWSIKCFTVLAEKRWEHIRERAFELIDHFVGWPMIIPHLTFVVIGLVVRPNRWKYPLVAAGIMQVILYSFHWWPGGSYLYEVIFPLTVLSASGITETVRLLKGYIESKGHSSMSILVLFGLLIASNYMGLVDDKWPQCGNHAYFCNMYELDKYMQKRLDPYNLIRERNIEEAIVFADSAPEGWRKTFYSTGTSPDMDDPVMIFIDQGDVKNMDFMKKFPEKECYRYHYMYNGSRLDRCNL